MARTSEPHRLRIRQELVELTGRQAREHAEERRLPNQLLVIRHAAQIANRLLFCNESNIRAAPGTSHNYRPHRLLGKMPEREEGWLEKLITVAQASEKIFRGMTGVDRAFLYAVAAATGYRKTELAALVPSCFLLEGEQPRIDLDGRHTKNGKAASQPVSATLAIALRGYLVGKPEGEPVWPGTRSERGSEMLKADAQAAEIDLVIQTKDGPQVLDFHSLRGTFATLLDTIDLSLKTRQELMRHSDPRLTMNRYTRANQSELDKAATRLPVTVPNTAAASNLACPNLVPATAGESGSEMAKAGNAPPPGPASELADGPEKQGNRSDSRGLKLVNKRAASGI